MIKIRNTFNPAKIQSRMRAAIGLYADTSAKKLEGIAKENASWTDRTANARQSIRGDFGWEGDKCKIILSGNIEYFVYLELANDEIYAILKPTIEENTPEILKGYQRLVR
jgi:hypothetical protein